MQKSWPIHIVQQPIRSGQTDTHINYSTRSILSHIFVILIQFFILVCDWNMVCVVRWMWKNESSMNLTKHNQPQEASVSFNSKRQQNEQYAAYCHILHSENEIRTKWMKTNRIGGVEKIVLARMFCSFAFFSFRFIFRLR